MTESEPDDRDLSKVPPALRATCWKAGQSGNPSGRPRGNVGLTNRIRKVMETEVKGGKQLADVLAEILVKEAMKNPAKMHPFIRDFIERDEGKVADKLQVEGVNSLRDLIEELDQSRDDDED